jgi:hypothetical protein
MSNRFIAGILGKTANTSATSAPGIWGMEQATDKKRTNNWIRTIASGGNVDALSASNGYVYHVFTSPGSFDIPSKFPASQNWDVLLVAGGGTGAEYGTPNGAGGGGAGGVVHHSQLNATGTLTITIGGGGGPVGASTKDNGDDSTIAGPSITTITAVGGGAGGYYGTAGDAGGSGGGGGGYGGNYSNTHAPGTQPSQNPTYIPQTGFNQYGNDGGSPSDSNPGNAGGGGGAGSVGGSSPGAEGGPDVSAGGAGQPFPGFAAPYFSTAPVPLLPNAWRDAIGDLGYFGGGGAGQNPYGSDPTSVGGVGGGGGYRDSNLIKDGVANTGGGGGGVSSGGGGNGGSGICIIRYQS